MGKNFQTTSHIYIYTVYIYYCIYPPSASPCSIMLYQFTDQFALRNSGNTSMYRSWNNNFSHTLHIWKNDSFLLVVLVVSLVKKCIFWCLGLPPCLCQHASKELNHSITVIVQQDALHRPRNATSGGPAMEVDLARDFNGDKPLRCSEAF